MTSLFIQTHLFLARHRGMVLASFVVFAIAAVFMGRNLRFNEDFTDMLPMSAPGIAEQVGALQHIRQAERLYIDVATCSPDAAQLSSAADDMTTALREVPHLTDLRGEVNMEDMGAAYGELQTQLPWLLSSNDLRALEPRLEPEAIGKRLAWLKQSMIQPQGMMYKNVVKTDPAGIGDAVSTRLRALQAGAGDARIVNGRITSADGRHVLINATPDFRSSQTGKSATLIAAILEAARSVEGKHPPGAVKISVTGAHRGALDNATMISRDSTRTSILATLAIAALIIAGCRRRGVALLALAPVLFGALGAVVVFYLTGDLVSAVALGCGSMLIGVTVDYGIYVVYTLDDSPPASRESLAATVAGIVPALAFGALTTMAAFFVMFLSPVSGHRQLGLFGALGVALAALFAIFILPVFIPVGATLSARPLPLTALLQRLFNWRSRSNYFILPALALLTLACAIGLLRLKFDGDLARLNGVTDSTRQDEKAVRETWGGALSLTTILVAGNTREEALAENERVLAALEKLRAQNVCESFSSIAPLMPSAQTRSANIAEWKKFWTPTRQLELRDSLDAASTNLGFRASAFATFLQKISAPEQSETADTNSALERLTSDFWSERDGKVYVATLAKVADTKRSKQLHDAVKEAVPGALMLNKAALSEEITSVARRALPLFGVMVAVLNAFLLFLLLGRIELVLVTILPMAAGILWTLGTLGIFGLPVDVANFVFVIFVVGVGGDYSLFLVLSELEPLRGHPDRTASTGGAVTMCALTALFGTGVLVLAHHPALFSVGLTALLGISYSLLATLFLVPPSVRWLANSNRRKSADTNLTAAQKLRAISRLYHFQGPYVSQFCYWKMKTDPLFGAVEKVAPKSGEILDIGCGYGLVAHWLTISNPQLNVRGVDFDGDKIRVAQAVSLSNAQVCFERRDILDWPTFPACDCALLCDVLHYFPHEMKANVLGKIFVALRPGGHLIMRDSLAAPGSTPRTVARAEKWAVRFGWNRTRHGLHFEDATAHRELLREAGFVEVEISDESSLGSNALLTARKPLL